MEDEICGSCGMVKWAHDVEGGCPTQAQVTEFMEAAKAIASGTVLDQGTSMTRLRAALKDFEATA